MSRVDRVAGLKWRASVYNHTHEQPGRDQGDRSGRLGSCRDQGRSLAIQAPGAAGAGHGSASQAGFSARHIAEHRDAIGRQVEVSDGELYRADAQGGGQ